MAKTLDELPIYPKAQALWRAVSAILKTPRLIRNQKLWKQIDEANDSIISNMEEGFEQPTDVAFANYLCTSKASLKEVMARLRQAQAKGHITEADVGRCERMAAELGRMLGGFIRYLYQSGFKDRGRYNLRRPESNSQPPAEPESHITDTHQGFDNGSQSD